jgi:exosortase A
LFCLAFLLIYAETAWSMVYIWTRSETFAHGFVIAPISLWLIWTQRDALAGVSPEPVWWVTLLLLPLGLVWLLAWLVNVAVVQQLALVAMLIVGIWAILGHQLALLLTFPLFFLFFAVPMGENLIAPMMEFTASSTVWLIERTGIPVYREGLNFTLPTGSWSVVEACSGVRYIIASVTVGVLYAYLTYRSWIRRLVFVLISAIVPVFANSARAYIIVMLGHLSDMTIATGADHLVYGWVFFGLVIFILFWLGAFFREDDRPQLSVQPAVTSQQPDARTAKRNLIVAVASALVLASIAPLVAYSIDRDSAQPAHLTLALPEAEGDWQHSPATAGWLPPSRVSGQQTASYRRDNGQRVDLTVQFADGTMRKADIVGSSALFNREGDGWMVTSQDRLRVHAAGGEVLAEQALLRKSQDEIMVWSWYLLGNVSTTNDYYAKLLQILARLGWAEPGSYRIVLTTPVHASHEDTRAVLQKFADDYMPTVYQDLHRAAENAR